MKRYVKGSKCSICGALIVAAGPTDVPASVIRTIRNADHIKVAHPEIYGAVMPRRFNPESTWKEIGAQCNPKIVDRFEHLPGYDSIQIPRDI